MGAGASTADPQEEIRTIRKGQVAEDASAGAILVKSASGLTKSSGWLDEPDPYAMTRLGPVGSSWADKDTPEACERTSCVASDTRDPVWQLAFPYALPAADVAWELHVRVYDKDYASFDDFLGEAVLKGCLGSADVPRGYVRLKLHPRAGQKSQKLIKGWIGLWVELAGEEASGVLGAGGWGTLPAEGGATR